MFPTLSFPVGREKLQGLSSGEFVSTGKWWGSGDRLWSLIKSWYIWSAMYLFVLVRSWAEVVAFMSPMMRGVQFSTQDLRTRLASKSSQSLRFPLRSNAVPKGSSLLLWRCGLQTPNLILLSAPTQVMPMLATSAVLYIIYIVL